MCNPTTDSDDEPRVIDETIGLFVARSTSLAPLLLLELRSHSKPCFTEMAALFGFGLLDFDLHFFFAHASFEAPRPFSVAFCNPTMGRRFPAPVLLHMSGTTRER